MDRQDTRLIAFAKHASLSSHLLIDRRECCPMITPPILWIHSFLSMCSLHILFSLSVIFILLDPLERLQAFERVVGVKLHTHVQSGRHS